jgi:large subunit ribosomal protein L21
LLEEPQVYAVISDRGRQAGVRVGDVVACDWRGDWKSGDQVTFSEVLLVSHEGTVKVGNPAVKGASVRAEVVGQAKGEKLVAYRFKRRKNVHVKRGHRQKYLRVRITDIQG